MSTRRIEKLSKLFQVEVGNCIEKLGFRAFVTVTYVELSPDLKNAKVFLSIIDKNPEAVFEQIKKRKHEIFEMLKARKLSLKFFPHIEFHFDKSGEYTQKIDKLLEKI